MIDREQYMPGPASGAQMQDTDTSGWIIQRNRTASPGP